MVEHVGRMHGHTESWNPLACSIDKDKASLLALRSVWPDIVIIYCLYHLLVWLNTLLRTLVYGVSSDDAALIMFAFREMACQELESDFNERWLTLASDLYFRFPMLFTRIKRALFCEAWKDTWPAWVRHTANLPLEVLVTVRSNMLSEAAIKFTKYNVLHGVRNKRKDILLDKLLFTKLAFHEVEAAHAIAGLTHSQRWRQKLATPSARAAGKDMAQSGVQLKRTCANGWQHFSVTSVSRPDHRWAVVLYPRFGTCDCPVGHVLGVSCKHIEACRFYLRRHVTNGGGRPARLKPREAAPEGHTYLAYGCMLPVSKPGRKRQGRASQGSLAKRARLVPNDE
jgi:hypothetical protein